jgi:hypothetical protein
MFVGAVPLEFVGQILDAVPFGDWGAVHVCCAEAPRPDGARRSGVRFLRLPPGSAPLGGGAVLTLVRPKRAPRGSASDRPTTTHAVPVASEGFARRKGHAVICLLLCLSSARQVPRLGSLAMT